MKLEKLKLSEIIPYENNPRKNDAAVNAVAESIRQCSYITPIIVDENHVIIAGHTRYKALMALGESEAECLVCDGLTEEQKKKYRFLDNKTGEKAAWDLMKLEVELEGLDLEGFDFFGMAVDIPLDGAGGGSEKELAGSTEIDAEVFGDEEFKYECPKCGFRFN
ncbi:ParB N-terminal domain-containing protein [Mediterraneibacter glycyrrhizinilyticus]|uniref:ParB N-terminal domain-containing protein n=1 Tax=Mediterraneibacter glycyrrhizinilyticus TaxID=342942 RepID=UPI0025A419C6|nr:ParB N-terminal domain-containing protein [Mediterraneibacter glycyrrhizinilyticus]MDM8210000.1 ParB N-terminal domain-containing protein [Mediterraneibacter glycyrrhizinilyticus]